MENIQRIFYINKDLPRVLSTPSPLPQPLEESLKKNALPPSMVKNLLPAEKNVLKKNLPPQGMEKQPLVHRVSLSPRMQIFDTMPIRQAQEAVPPRKGANTPPPPQPPFNGSRPATPRSNVQRPNPSLIFTPQTIAKFLYPATISHHTTAQIVATTPRITTHNEIDSELHIFTTLTTTTPLPALKETLQTILLGRERDRATEIQTAPAQESVSPTLKPAFFPMSDWMIPFHELSGIASDVQTTFVAQNLLKNLFESWPVVHFSNKDAQQQTASAKERSISTPISIQLTQQSLPSFSTFFSTIAAENFTARARTSMNTSAQTRPNSFTPFRGAYIFFEPFLKEPVVNKPTAAAAPLFVQEEATGPAIMPALPFYSSAAPQIVAILFAAMQKNLLLTTTPFTSTWKPSLPLIVPFNSTSKTDLKIRKKKKKKTDEEEEQEYNRVKKIEETQT